MATQKRMDQIRNILTHYARTRSVKATAKQLAYSRNTVRGYVRPAQNHPGGITALLELDDEAFHVFFRPPKSATDPEWARREYADSQVDHWATELKKTGVTRHLLWEEYRAQHPDGYGYTQFCHLLNC